MAPKPRTTSFKSNEDRHLAHIYLDISQDPIIGSNQSKGDFWRCIADKYNSERPNSTIQHRTQRSVYCRMKSILKECRAFNGCVRQVEMLNPSGANEQNILDRADEMLKSRTGNGFKFGHVWAIMKEFVQSEDISGENNIETPTMSPNPSLSSFSINLTDDISGGDDGDGGGSSSQRPEGVKKAKLKRKQNEQDNDIVKTITEQNAALREVLIAGQNKRAESAAKKAEALAKNAEALEMIEENKILTMKLDTIDDPSLREYFQMEQQRILQKKREAQARKHNYQFNPFDSYYPNAGSSGDGLPDY